MSDSKSASTIGDTNEPTSVEGSKMLPIVLFKAEFVASTTRELGIAKSSYL